MMANYRFSLILATLGRTKEVNSFFLSLVSQSYKNYEVIVVDQNQDERLIPIINQFKPLMGISRLNSLSGLSRARNVAIPHIEGDIVAFPDDDCIYPPDLLKDVAARFVKDRSLDGITGRVLDPQGVEYARFDRSPGLITIQNIWQRTSSFTMFFRRSVIETIGKFDEDLGIGAGTPWEGGEDIDYPVRAINQGFRIVYDPEITVLHPNPLESGYAALARRSYKYGAGIGRVWKKHRYPLWLVLYYLARPIGGILVSLSRGDLEKANYHWRSFQGRLAGWIAPYEPEKSIGPL